MTLKDVLDAYYTHSGKASDIVRQLGFAGIAIVWLFRAEAMPGPRLDPQLILPSALIVAGLTLDLLQYVAATAIWGIYNRIKERAGIGRDVEFEAPSVLNWPAITFFWLKTVAMVSAYVLLLSFLVHKLA